MVLHLINQASSAFLKRLGKEEHHFLGIVTQKY